MVRIRYCLDGWFLAAFGPLGMFCDKLPFWVHKSNKVSNGMFFFWLLLINQFEEEIRGKYARCTASHNETSLVQMWLVRNTLTRTKKQKDKRTRRWGYGDMPDLTRFFDSFLDSFFFL